MPKDCESGGRECAIADQHLPGAGQEEDDQAGQPNHAWFSYTACKGRACFLCGSEWCKGRERIMRELGDVLVLPWIPLLSEPAEGRHVVRAVAEFMNWFDDLQDPEASPAHPER
jgi:hypothetical protein